MNDSIFRIVEGEVGVIQFVQIKAATTSGDF